MPSTIISPTAIVLFGIVFVILVISIAVAVVRIRRYFRRPDFYGLDKEGIKRRFKEIEKIMRKPGEIHLKLAVLEADKILDQVLKAAVMPGATMAERLRFAQYRYPKLKSVWWAHKIRNQLVHETSFHLTSRMAKSAIRAYKQALKELSIL